MSSVSKFAPTVALAYLAVVATFAKAQTTATQGLVSMADAFGCNADWRCIDNLVVYIAADGTTNAFLFVGTPSGFLHGGGQIPASDYVVSKSGAILKTDTTTNPEFTGEICNWGGYCTGFSGGVISLTGTTTTSRPQQAHRLKSYRV
jgi:hypothetical protein